MRKFHFPLLVTRDSYFSLPVRSVYHKPPSRDLPNRSVSCSVSINYSDAPNISPDFTADRHGIDIAVREIAKSEEITADYGIVEGVRPA
jgi:hypothetical protein